MPAELTPMDMLRLWYLAVNSGRAYQAEMRPKMGKKERELLLAHNLVKSGQQGRKIWVELTDYCWVFLEGNDSSVLVNAKTPYAAGILEKVLMALQRMMKARELRLAEVLTLPPDPEPAATTAGGADNELWSRFRQSWEERHHPDGGILLRDLRPALADVPREEVDKALIRWQEEGRIVLYPFDDPQRVTPEDREAALDIAGRATYTAHLK